MEKVATLCPQKPACGFFLLEWASRLQHSVHAAVAPGPMEWHCFLTPLSSQRSTKRTHTDSPFILAHLQWKTISALGRTKVSLNLTHAARSWKGSLAIAAHLVGTRDQHTGLGINCSADNEIIVQVIAAGTLWGSFLDRLVAVFFELAKGADLMVCWSFLLHLWQGANCCTPLLHWLHTFGKLQLGRRLNLGNHWLLGTWLGSISDQLKVLTGSTSALFAQQLIFGRWKIILVSQALAAITHRTKVAWAPQSWRHGSSLSFHAGENVSHKLHLLCCHGNIGERMAKLWETCHTKIVETWLGST